MTKNKYLVAILALALLMAMLELNGCFKVAPPPHRQPLQKKIEALKVKLDTMYIHDTTNVIKWKTAKGKTDTVIVWANLNAPDTCKTYIDTLVRVYDKERETAQNLISNRDSIISSQSSMICVNEMLIENEIAYSDSVVKSRSHKYLRGLRDGLVIGAGAGFVITKIIEK